MATYVNRHERKESIWDISNYLRTEIAKIPYVKQIDVSPSGSTAMASLRLLQGDKHANRSHREGKICKI